MIGIFLKKIFSKPRKSKFMGQPSLEKREKKIFHPKYRANCLSNLFFCWTFPSLAKGFISGFTEADLDGTLPQHESSKLGDRLEAEWFCEIITNTKPTLWKPLFRMFGIDFMAIGIIIFINEFIVKLSQPVLIWKLITTHTAFNGKAKENEAYIYAFLIVMSSFFNVFCFNCSLIYRKSLKLNKNSLNKAATGQIVNLLSNDLNRFDKLFLQMHYLWAAPLEAFVILYLLYVMLDVSAIVGITIFFLFIPIQIFMGIKYSQFRLRTALKTDERVRLINEIISGIQVIKMYTWEKLFVGFTNKLRKEEISYIRGTSYLKTFQNSLNKFISKGAVFSCVLFYVLTGNHLKSQYVFVLKSFYNLLKQSMTSDFPEAIKNIAEASVTIHRIEEFLLSSEIKSTKYEKNNLEKGISLEKASAKWSSSSCDTLTEINFDANVGELITIVGSVGSGKTSLINVVLQELPLKEGKLAVKGRISYACQESWLFAGTVRENILFGQPLDPAKYNKVVKVCALNHDFDLLPYGDNSIVGDRGITLSGGQKARICLARAVYKSADIYILDDPLSAVDTSVAKQLFDKCISNYLKNKCVILVTHQTQYLKKSDKIYLLENGKIVASGDYEHIRNCGEDFARLLQKEVECEDTLNDECEKKMTSDEYEEKFCEIKHNGKISFRIYKEYLLSGGWFLFTILFLMFVLSQSIQSGTDYFESYWVNLEENLNRTTTQPGFFTRNNCIYVYSGLILSVLIFSFLTCMSFYSYFMNTSIKMHRNMFSSIIKARLNFFYTNPAGSILNRFSKDMGAADTNVPKFLLDTIQNGLNVFAVFTLVAIVNPWMLISSVCLLSLFYAIRTIYIATSRELKRIEAISRSPVYSHLNESLQGLETIRAFGIQARQSDTFDRLLNGNTSAFYMIISTSTAFSLWLSLLCSVYVALVTGSCFIGHKTYGGSLGLIITQAIGLSELLQWGMFQWSEFENEMTSVERIIQYKNTKPEEVEDGDFSKSWPESSSIRFENVTLKYKEDIPAALNNLSFEVAPKEKIGIVGRTGAGKTSIISALFRLARFDGAICIGGTNINELPLEIVRSNISIIPQEPVLFSGTVRENLDPFSQFSDSELWAILDDLDLKNFVSNLPAGLEGLILEKGSNLSVGQRQLFCLARALLRKNHILVLDEATASVDYKTDSLIQSTIKKKLVDCTVLIIAHRLHTIMDCDKVLVMDSGRNVEFDHPFRLMQNEDGALYDLVSKTGPAMTSHLIDIASKNYTRISEITRL